MSREVRWFIRSSLVWLVLGALLGVLLAVFPSRLALLRPAHLHMNLLGFMSMMIFGVAYHILPRFTGVPVRSQRLVLINLLLSNSGLAVLVLGWAMRRVVPAAPMPTISALLTVGGLLAAGGAVSFVVNVWGMLSGPPAVPGSRLAPELPCGGAGPPSPLIQLGRKPQQ
jgi:cytochrome c oxidase cbb3-type subunit 1